LNRAEEILEEIKKRKDRANYYYNNAGKFYEAKNLSKASEFLWGALNQLAYAIGLLHDKKLSEHGKVVRFIEELANTSDSKEVAEQMADGLASAQSIHANFYHDFMDEVQFTHHKDKVDKLLTKLAEMLEKELLEIGIKL